MRYWLLGSVLSCSLMAFAARAEYRLDKSDMENAIRQEFAGQGIDEVEVELFGGKTDYHFEQADNAKIMLSNFKLDEEQNRFTADAEIFADGESEAKTKLVGRYYKMVEAWVPIKDIAKETILRDQDLQPIKVREIRLKNGSYKLKGDIVGKQAAKALKSGKLVEKGDLQEEVIIKKGQAVTAVYNKKGLQITTKMQALDNAAKGQTVRLFNTSSKKEIIGIAKEAGLVEISNE